MILRLLRAAGGSDRAVLFLGHWKCIPTSLTYQGTSTANNNRMLRLLLNPKLFTSSDIALGRIVPPTRRTKKSTVRRFSSQRSWSVCSGVAMIISNAGVMLTWMGVHSTMMVYELTIAVFILISSMPPCVDSMTTDVELCMGLHPQSSSEADHPHDETVTTSFTRGSILRCKLTARRAIPNRLHNRTCTFLQGII